MSWRRYIASFSTMLPICTAHLRIRYYERESARIPEIVATYAYACWPRTGRVLVCTAERRLSAGQSAAGRA